MALDKFKAALKERIEQAKVLQNKVVRVGIVEHQHYDDGTPVAYVAVIHEYGADFVVPERKAVIHRRIEKNGDWSKKYGNKFVRKQKSNFATEVTIPAHRVKIDPRPFFRPTISEKQSEWRQDIINGLAANRNAADILELVGMKAAGDVRETIAGITSPPLSEATKKA